MSNKHHRLCAENRKVIANMKQAGKTQNEIAQAVGCSQSTISKELSRNRGKRGYRPCQAHRLATERKSQKRTRPKVVVGIIKDEVEARLRIKHSPDQISKSLVLRNLNVSHEAIYQHIANDRKAGGDLALNLRINGRRRYRRRSKIGRGEKIPNRVDIGKRPAVVCRRKRYGDWEADLIQGGAGSGFLLSVYERKSRVGRLHLLPDKSSAETMKAIVTVLHGLKVNSITYDNGLEFAMHELVNELLDCESYFWLLGICFWREAPETAVGPDRRRGNGGLIYRHMCASHRCRTNTRTPAIYHPPSAPSPWARIRPKQIFSC